MEPADKFLHARQDLVAVVDHAVHITDKAFFLVEIEDRSLFHMFTAFLVRHKTRRPAFGQLPPAGRYAYYKAFLSNAKEYFAKYLHDILALNARFSLAASD